PRAPACAVAEPVGEPGDGAGRRGHRLAVVVQGGADHAGGVAILVFLHVRVAVGEITEQRGDPQHAFVVDGLARSPLARVARLLLAGARAAAPVDRVAVVARLFPEHDAIPAGRRAAPAHRAGRLDL